jgi:hypothetical protein
MAVPISGTPVLVRGLREKPAVVAADSQRPSRSKRAASTAADVGGAARFVQIADRHSDVVERGQRVAVLSL